MCLLQERNLFAVLSASSFPRTPTWAGTQKNPTVFPNLDTRFNTVIISTIRSGLAPLSPPFRAISAAVESEHIINVIDCVDRWLLYSYICDEFTGVLGNELRLGVLLNGKLTGLWEPELLLVGRGSNTYFMQKYDNKCICCYSGFFCDILFLNVKVYLWLKWYTVQFFVSGQTYKISKGWNNYCSHCIWIYASTDITLQKGLVLISI